MGSLIYEIINSNKLRKNAQKAHQHNRAKKASSIVGQKAPLQKTATLDSMKQYQNHAVKYGKWCKAVYGCRHFEDCRAHVQAYADYLVTKGLSASTVHTYIAGVCSVWDIPMCQIRKPIRHTAENTRSRGPKAVDQRADAKRDISPRFFDLATIVGIRRNECEHLRGNDLAMDESGYLCVVVRCGKGGKRQLQRVPPGTEDFIKSYFDGTENFIFSRAEINNKIDVHGMRHVAAQERYFYYLHRLEQVPAYRAQLTAEIKARWRQYNTKPINAHELSGDYWIRGPNRVLAAKNNLPFRYDRLALMATSVFHLSHWRNDVSVGNYILAVLHDLLNQ